MSTTTPKYWTNWYPVQAASKVMTFHCIYILQALPHFIESGKLCIQMKADGDGLSQTQFVPTFLFETIMQKVSYCQRWVWRGSRHGRQWRAGQLQRRQSHQKMWSGGPQPGWVRHGCWPAYPWPPLENPCWRSKPSPRQPSLFDTKIWG